MKKLFTLAAAAMVAFSASAQTVEGSKTFDNFYVGVNGGLATKMTNNKWMKGLNPNFGVRVGRNFTPVFGLALDGNAYFSNKPFESVGTFVRGINLNLMGTVNLSNWFCGYLGQPRTFEVSALYGWGWGHLFGQHDKIGVYTPNEVTSKAALDFAFNLGEKKAWQVYIEPAVIWGMRTRDIYNNGGHQLNFGVGGAKYNINGAMAQLNVGVVYKFKNSNGTHNFKIAQLRDQSEVDALNSEINNLREELAKEPKTVIKEIVKETPAAKEVKVENLLFVTFQQGKSILTKDNQKALNGIKAGSHVQIVGTASPEGSKEINDRLSQARADVVAKYLKDRGVIVDEASGKGVQGNTSGRLAIIFVK